MRVSQRHYEVHGYRGHWEVRATNGATIRKGYARKESAQWLRDELERAFMRGMAEGVQQAEAVVLNAGRKDWSQ